MVRARPDGGTGMSGGVSPVRSSFLSRSKILLFSGAKSALRNATELRTDSFSLTLSSPSESGSQGEDFVCTSINVMLARFVDPEISGCSEWKLGTEYQLE